MESFLTPYGLSNSGEEKLQFTPFGGGPKLVCSDGLRAGNIESHNFFLLGFILVKFHIRTRLIESFPTIFRTWCGEEKLHFTPVHTLCQLKRDEALILPPQRVVGFQEPCLKAIDRKSFERSNFLVLRPVLLKIAYFNSGNRQFFFVAAPHAVRQWKAID